jgi:hypothetical protein
MEFAEDFKRAISEDMAVSREAVDLKDAAVLAALMTDEAALSQHVEHALLVS